MKVLLIVVGIIALRLIDVSIGALRITYLVRGRRWLAGILGFFESLSWVIAAGLVLTDLQDWYATVAYAAGFGLGTVLGASLDRWIGSGEVFLRILAPVETPPVATALRAGGFGVTVLNGEGLEGDVRLTITALARRRLGEAVSIVQRENPEAFVTIDEVTATRADLLRARRNRK